ncbi:MAG TPA: cbb3-type cytochrome c oxidase subunit 3 [Rhodocyclaceae bacterium]|jgi:cytochrome c oxidase cbb3-type subunit 4|nr:cbb3-type cytochrome c oxidase subunit 3 [Rhodocyclaceae bacterium]
MDINDLRSLMTVVAFLLFIGIVWWAWSDKSKQAFDEAARLPLEDDFPLTPIPIRVEPHEFVRKGHEQ